MVVDRQERVVTAGLLHGLVDRRRWQWGDPLEARAAPVCRIDRNHFVHNLIGAAERARHLDDYLLCHDRVWPSCQRTGDPTLNMR